MYRGGQAAEDFKTAYEIGMPKGGVPAMFSVYPDTWRRIRTVED